MKAEDFDRKFDDGESIIECLDLTNIKRSNSMEEFQESFFAIFSSENFYRGQNYLEYMANPQTNDEDNIVDTKIVLPLLSALGYQSGEVTKNQTDNSSKDSLRPDFQVKLSEENRCFLVEDKNTAFDLSQPEPLRQLVNYAPIRGYRLGLLCNGRSLLGWDLSDQNEPLPVLSLNIEEMVRTYQGFNSLAGEKQGLEALTKQQQQTLRTLYRRYHRVNFEGIEVLIQQISKPLEQWRLDAWSKADNPNFDELLIADLKTAIALLEEDVLSQLNVLLEEYKTYSQTIYQANDNLEADRNAFSIPQKITNLRKEILNYLRVSGLVEVEEFSWADEQLIRYANRPAGKIQPLADQFLEKLKTAESKKIARANQAQDSTLIEQLDLLSPISESKQKILGIKVKPQTKITQLDKGLQMKLKQYQDEVLAWQAWSVRQQIKYDRSIKTQQFFQAWKDLVSKTIFQEASDEVLTTEFARQTAYVYIIRLLMVRICEDKDLIKRKFSDGGFRTWREEVEPQYLDLAQGMSMDYLLDMSYRSAQSVYAHFFSNEDLFNWYRMNTNILIRILHILNNFNLEEIDSDIIGMVYGRYVTEGKHEQGRYFTPKKVVEYMLDCIGYTADNPEIRDKKLIDLAGGSGSFLVHASRRLIDSYRSPSTGKINTLDAPLIIQQVKNLMFCLDINPFACYLAETNLLIQVIDLLKQIKESGNLKDFTIDRFNVYNTDSLLFTESEDLRTPLLNPILDLELSIVSQIKHRTGQFSDGFDFVVGNPPYVSPSVGKNETNFEEYRQSIGQSGYYQTLYEKWDLFVPFVELSTRLSKIGGRIALIVSRGFQSNNYAEKLREHLVENLIITQVDFLNNIKLFSDAVVNNTIFFLENSQPSATFVTQRLLHRDIFKQIEVMSSLSQHEQGVKVFKQFSVTQSFDNILDLEEICYCSIGMVLNANEKTAQGEFTKDDLLSQHQDSIHCKKYLDGENFTSEFAIDNLRFLEWDTERVPSKIRRVTIPELYDLPKILFGMTSFPTYDRGMNQGEGFYVPDSVRICVRWDDVYAIKRLENEARQMYEFSKKYQRQLGDSKGKKVKLYDRAREQANLSKKFDLRYIAAILASSFGKRFLLENNRDENIMTTSPGKLPKSRIYPDDLKEFPIKNISLKKQQPFIEKVDLLITGNWEIYHWMQQGHKIKFNYHDDSCQIEINFLEVLGRINPPCWNFFNAVPQRFEVIGDRTLTLSKIKIKENKLLIGRNETLLQSDSPLVLRYLENYLPQFENRGLAWQNLLNLGQIPKTDSDIASLFAECDRLKQEIQQKIATLRQTYQALDEMVNRLYQNRSVSDEADT